MGRQHQEAGGRLGSPSSGVYGGIWQIGNSPLLIPAAVVATGGSVTNITIGGISYRVHTFLSSGTLTVPSSLAVQYLVVGGGGGGGRGGGGGGGAGGFLAGSITLSGQAYSIVVGAGGLGAGVAPTFADMPGKNSTFAGLTAVGGGAGGNGMNATSFSPTSGGSGGGAGKNTNAAGGAGTSGQGNNGGNVTGTGATGGGGGGGAGAVGQTGTFNPLEYAGSGGIGLISSINGSSTYYAGGGGAGTNWDASTKTQGLGGLGGGGNGANASSGGNANGTNGQANTGGGGGGADWNNGNGGNGGSGIVIVRYVI